MIFKQFQPELDEATIRVSAGTEFRCTPSLKISSVLRWFKNADAFLPETKLFLIALVFSPEDSFKKDFLYYLNVIVLE